jgi:hypothetical protein
MRRGFFLLAAFFSFSLFAASWHWEQTVCSRCHRVHFRKVLNRSPFTGRHVRGVPASVVPQTGPIAGAYRPHSGRQSIPPRTSENRRVSPREQENPSPSPLPSRPEAPSPGDSGSEQSQWNELAKNYDGSRSVAVASIGNDVMKRMQCFTREEKEKGISSSERSLYFFAGSKASESGAIGERGPRIRLSSIPGGGNGTDIETMEYSKYGKDKGEDGYLNLTKPVKEGALHFQAIVGGVATMNGDGRFANFFLKEMIEPNTGKTRLIMKVKVHDNKWDGRDHETSVSESYCNELTEF